MNASILGPLTLCLNHGHKPIRHGIEHFFPVIRPLAQDVPTGIVKTVSFDAALLKFDDISPYVFDRIHINGHPSISPHTFSIGFIYMDTLRRPRQNFDFVPMLNESFFFTMRDVWMGDWSWTSFTFWSGNIALMEGRKTFCKISRFFSFTNFPSNLTKSCLGHHSRNICWTYWICSQSNRVPFFRYAKRVNVNRGEMWLAFKNSFFVRKRNSIFYLS